MKSVSGSLVFLEVCLRNLKCMDQRRNSSILELAEKSIRTSQVARFVLFPALFMHVYNFRNQIASVSNVRMYDCCSFFFFLKVPMCEGNFFQLHNHFPHSQHTYVVGFSIVNMEALLRGYRVNPKNSAQNILI